MFKTSGRASFLIILFQFLQYYVFVVLSGDAFALFRWHFYCDSFNREEDCIQNLLCTQRTIGNYWTFAVFSGPDLIGVVGWCEGAVYLTSPGRPTDIGLQLGKACYPCSG